MKDPKFTPAVLEINNPEELILFRKVIIPASMGDDTETVPAVGRYKNVLLHYDANDTNYLYSSDGIPTKITSAVPKEVLDRITALEEGIETETAARESADATLTTRVEAEESARAAADTALENDIASESASRQAADTRLETAISGLIDALATETTARTTADTTLQNNIDTVANNLSVEITAREGADEHLHDLIDAVSEDLGDEEDARAAADTALGGRIDAEAEARAEADTTLSGAITTEASARQTADEGLQSQIDAITASSDVKDIVGTKAELDSYDTVSLGDKDIIKVLQDESQNDQTTYYRWATSTSTFTLIGAEGPYYTKTQSDTMLDDKLDANTTFWGQTASNGAVSGEPTINGQIHAVSYGTSLTDAVNKGQVDEALLLKQDKLTAGDNITIDEDVISADGGVKKLTTADYDYTGAGISGIALWKLEPGFYIVGEAVNLFPTTSVSMGGVRPGKTVFVDPYDADYVNITMLGTPSQYVTIWRVSKISGVLDGSFQVVNTLTSSSPASPLSANQGKVLNDKIGGDLANLDTEDKTSLINAINELAGQGGGAVTLTSADYNWPESSPTGVAQWLLKDGAYQVGENGLSIYPDNASSARTDVLSFTKATYVGGGTSGSLMIYATTELLSTVAGRDSTLHFWAANSQTGARLAYGRLSAPVLDSAGDSATSAISQNAATGMVFADPGTNTQVRIGADAYSTGSCSTAVGSMAQASSWGAVAIGRGARAESADSVVAIGENAFAAHRGSVALGVGAQTKSAGEIQVGTDSSLTGHNNTLYRVIRGVYDGEEAHDAVTVGQMNAAIAEAGGADELETSDWEGLWQ